jgi:hypothetical protein
MKKRWWFVNSHAKNERKLADTYARESVEIIFGGNEEPNRAGGCLIILLFAAVVLAALIIIL